jgi:hypothetical protein
MTRSELIHALIATAMERFGERRVSCYKQVLTFRVWVAGKHNLLYTVEQLFEQHIKVLDNNCHKKYLLYRLDDESIKNIIVTNRDVLLQIFCTWTQPRYGAVMSLQR